MDKMEIGFVDYSIEERDQILSTLSLLTEHTVLDELGIGTLRDAYSELLFPGISTIQTRAKYFVLIPYLFQLSRPLIKKGRLKNERALLQWINQETDNLVPVLVECSPAGSAGIIGSTLLNQQKAVKQKITSIYWSGLRALGIVQSPRLSLSSACRLFMRQVQQENAVELRLDDETYDDATAADTGEAVFSPLKLPADFPEKVSIALSRGEAEYLRSHILRSSMTRDSLLAFLLREQISCDSFDSVPTDRMPEGLRSIYENALAFSNFIYGPQIRYNVIYAEGKDEAMNAEFENWMDQFSNFAWPLDSMLNPPAVSANPARLHTLGNFCRNFAEAAADGNDDEMDRLIVNREICVKGARSKLKKPEEYRYSKPVHDVHLDYRFQRASVILHDIFEGLEGK